MDSHYNFDGAAKVLAEVAEERIKCDSDQLANIVNFDTLKPVFDNIPRCWRFITSNGDSAEQEELVLSVQGIITQMDLPPVTRRPAKRMQGYLRQSVQLTGLGLPLFQNCVDNLQRLQQILARQVPHDAMEPLTPTAFLTHPAIEIGTRYFTSRRDDPTGESLPFDRMTDPKGILTAMAADGYFHGPDNKVHYYRLLSTTSNSQFRFEAVDPVVFRIGDIVEVQATVTAVPVKRGKFKTVIQLRSLALISGSFTEDATSQRARLKLSVEPTAPRPSIKRKVGYETLDNEIAEARRGMVNMAMNDRLME